MALKCGNINVIDLFESKDLVKICAPMVRYSKLQFRNLVGLYGCDLAFTPMILADSFCKSEKARNNEFTTNNADLPVIIQFAANTVHDFVGAACLASPFCNGVDLNCGCPQTWAKKMGLGCSMLNEPELIFNIVRQCRNQISKPFTVSVKMRINKNISKTVDICKQLEMAGASFLTVHARTADQNTGDINSEALRLLTSQVKIPIVANGGVKTLEDCYKLQEKTNCKGVMVANGILNNPTIFMGNSITSMECIQNWVNICYNSTFQNIEMLQQNVKPVFDEKPYNLTFQCFHHHLVFMLDKILSRKQKQVFNNFQHFQEVLGFLKTSFGIVPKHFNNDMYDHFKLIKTDYSNRDQVYNKLKPNDINKIKDILYDCESNKGKYFNSKIQENENQFCDLSGMFLENG
ncbi:unnamed protein product [Brassicogethes aeneus]|uniref:DUS-like FMN-binding domain-containing protein n=1 Tax=Brassicogethes aeneus TaxID=1431903 RepID=A0A9P0FF90_BRAAE|nr:unnamed protein product [Brassicogethes aeneus]